MLIRELENYAIIMKVQLFNDIKKVYKWSFYPIHFIVQPFLVEITRATYELCLHIS